jgi:hypothetical protein
MCGYNGLLPTANVACDQGIETDSWVKPFSQQYIYKGEQGRQNEKIICKTSHFVTYL